MDTKERYHKDPEFRQRCIDSALKWQRTHKKKANARGRRYYHNHHEERLAASKDYQETNKKEIAIKRKKKYDSDPEFRKKVKQGVKKWRNENREKYNKYQREHAKLCKSS